MLTWKSHLLIVFCLPLLLMTAFYYLFNAGNIHFVPSFLNDQINYITVTRHLVDFGHFIIPNQYQGIGTIIVPDFLKLKTTRLYMPGYYLYSAIFYKLLGSKGFIYVLPNILAYFFSAGLIFFIAKRLYEVQTALLSTLLFIFFPLNILFALTAMSEMTLVFIGLLTFATLILLPMKLKSYAIPLLIAVVYLFKQNEILLIIPMLAYLYDQQKVSWKKLLFILFATMALCFGIQTWQEMQGLLPLHARLVSAYQPNAAEFLNGIHYFYSALLNNLNTLRIKYSPDWGETPYVPIISAIEILILFSVSLMSSYYDSKKTWFPISCSMLLLAMFFSCISIYSGILITVLRMLMIGAPFIMIQTARVLSFQRKLESSFTALTLDSSFRWNDVFKKMLISIYLLISLFSCAVSAANIKMQAKISQNDNQFIESVHPIPQQMLLAPLEIVLEYTYRHYPQLISITPDNSKTLLALNQFSPVGTVIIPDRLMQQKFNAEDFTRIGLISSEHKFYNGVWYSIFKRETHDQK